MNDNELFGLKHDNWKWMKIFSSRKGGDRDEAERSDADD